MGVDLEKTLIKNKLNRFFLENNYLEMSIAPAVSLETIIIYQNKKKEMCSGPEIIITIDYTKLTVYKETMGIGYDTAQGYIIELINELLPIKPLLAKTRFLILFQYGAKLITYNLTNWKTTYEYEIMRDKDKTIGLVPDTL